MTRVYAAYDYSLYEIFGMRHSHYSPGLWYDSENMCLAIGCDNPARKLVYAELPVGFPQP